MTAWTPSAFVLGGRFATYDDLDGATRRLSEVAGSEIIVVTFSTRYLLPSISCAVGREPDWGSGVVEALRQHLQTELRNAINQIEFVEGLVREHLLAVGVAEPITHYFGGDLDRPGKLAVVVGGAASLNSAMGADLAALAAACALGSRPAAFTRDTSIEGRLLRATNETTESDDEPPDWSPLRVTEGLLRLVAETLETSAAAVYEGDSIHPHRASSLELRGAEAVPEIPPWMPQSIPFVREVEQPRAPELGGSRFAELGEFVMVCVASRRRLVGVIADGHTALGLPYGLDPVNNRAVGLLVLVWPPDDPNPLGVYEMAVSRMVALYLARDNEERRADDSVQLVTSQLSFISGLRPTSPSHPLAGRADDLKDRRDVSLVAEPVAGILRGLVDLTGAVSVTCRLIAGAGGDPFSRYLLRLHCEGADCRNDSPDAIPLDDASRSVNAWVATRGEPVHLRNIKIDGATGRATSPDLVNYDGLDEVTIYRENVQTELCVPIFAEHRVVGTVNIEAVSTQALDKKAEIVSEYAQLIGIALLEARRRIGVETVTEAGGFLDHRHELESKLERLRNKIDNESHLRPSVREDYTRDIEELKEIVYVKRLAEDGELVDGLTVRSVMESAMRSVNWAESNTHLSRLLLEDVPGESANVLDASLDAEPANALKFALGQAVHNVRRYAESAEAATGRGHLAMFRVARRTIGGEENAYVAVSSVTWDESILRIPPQRVFREPLEGDERVALGTYLAGEAMRRCGGSAFLRVYRHESGATIVEPEFSVPIKT